MKKLKIIIASVIILAGAFIIAYPYLFSFYYEMQKDKLMEAWDSQTIHVPFDRSKDNTQSGSDSDEEGDDSSVINSQGDDIRTPPPIMNDDEVIEEDTSFVFDLDYAIAQTVGKLQIPSIKFNAPILYKDTTKNLNISVCELAGSPAMGSEGNYIIAGHKSRIYGRHFNRLNELKKDDDVILTDGENIYNYKVTKKLQVTPEDIWVLDDVQGKSILTLITCDYSVKPIGRLIVICEKTE